MSPNVLIPKKPGRNPKPSPRRPIDYTAEEQAARLAYSEIPRHLGLESARTRIVELFDADISVHTLKRDTESGHLTTNIVGGRRRYSDRSLYDYVVLNSVSANSKAIA